MCGGAPVWIWQGSGECQARMVPNYLQFVGGVHSRERKGREGKGTALVDNVDNRIAQED